MVASIKEQLVLYCGQCVLYFFVGGEEDWPGPIQCGVPSQEPGGWPDRCSEEDPGKQDSLTTLGCVRGNCLLGPPC